MTSAQVWPDGSFGVSCLQKRLREDSPLSKRELSTDEECFQRSVELHGLIATLECLNPGTDVLGTLDEAFGQKKSPPLGLSSVPNSHTLKRGLNGISSYGRQLVKNAAFCLEQRYGKKHLSFLTLTLPTTSTADNRTITENWHEIVRVFVQWLKRRLERGGIRGEIVGCTEIQEDRSEWQQGILGLHLHLIFPGRSPKKSWLITPSQFREAWTRAVSKCIPVTSEGYYWNAVENVERVKYSASAYLGKYISKGVKAVSRFKALYPSHKLPSAWYTITAELRHLTICCKVGGSRAGEILQSAIEDGQIQYFRRVFIAYYSDSEGNPKICGWYGVLSPEGRRLIGLDKHVKMRVSAIHGIRE